MNTPLVVISNLKKVFVTPVETVMAVDEVGLELFPGEFIALMGPSGCGKSTLLGLLGGLIQPTSGSVILMNKKISDIGPNAQGDFRLKNIGLIFQEHNLIDEFTVLENVMLPLEVQGLGGALTKSNALDSLKTVGLLAKSHAFPDQLSGGQKQRVGIARSLMGNKQVILADEPTGSLDSSNSRNIFSIFKALAANGLCVIVATHDEMVEEYATRVLKMRDGMIVTDQPVGTKSGVL